MEALTPELVLHNASTDLEGQKQAIVIMLDREDNVSMYSTGMSKSQWALVQLLIHSVAVTALHDQLEHER